MAQDDNELTQLPNLPEHMTRAPEAWERDPRESDRAFSLFSLYRQTAYPSAVPGNMGVYKPRSMTNFARDVGLSDAYVYHLASQHSWTARCAAYDRVVDRERTRADLSDVERMRELQRDEYADMRETAKLMRLRLLEALESGTMPVKPSEYVAWMKALHEGERLLNGEATSRTDSRTLAVTLDLTQAPAAVREWYRAQALAAQNSPA